jgi:hypothetical protein
MLKKNRPSTWWKQKQQLKKGEEEIKRLREALSNTRFGNKDR